MVATQVFNELGHLAITLNLGEDLGAELPEGDMVLRRSSALVKFTLLKAIKA